MKLKLITASVALALMNPAHAVDNALDEVVVTAPQQGANKVDATTLRKLRPATSDSASLLRDVPGVSLYGAGGVSSLPALHGLADDRLRIKVDGMDLISSCPNHMNPPLSYVDPNAVAALDVYPGIAPVSVGGDAIGGTIVAQSRAPVFAASGSLTQGEVGTFYRSNNKARGANVSVTHATEQASLSYDGAMSQADNYTAGGDFKTTTATGRAGHTLPLDEVGSTAYETRNHSLGLAFKNDSHLFEARMGIQDLPYQLYPNQRMDMLDNQQKSVNLRYLGQLDWGSLEARLYRETVDHYMNFGADKQLVYGTATGGMPMYTQGKTTGASVKTELAIARQSLLRMGAEMQQYRLDDWWPASGTGMMSPYTFWNIHNGQRDRTALFGEWEARKDAQWMTLLGVRYEKVSMNADPVHGYNVNVFPTTVGMDMMNQNRDASLFNNSDRNKTDNNLDLSALARYTASSNGDVEFGFAHKVRSPNVYQRYTWSTWTMAAVMNNIVGDGNGYLGDINLKPEKANTLSATFDWHAADRRWEFKATPYYTKVTDYIDAVQWNSMMNMPTTANTPGQFNVLKYVNQSARLYGFDASGRMMLADSGWEVKGMINYTNGKNETTGGGLYNIMPLNAKLTLTQQLGAWNGSAELVAVKSKDNVSAVRNEIKTPGYGLLNLRGGYVWKQVSVDFGVENVFNKFYYLPTGGTYTGQGMTMSINGIPYGIAVPGMGRSLYAGLNYKF